MPPIAVSKSFLVCGGLEMKNPLTSQRVITFLGAQERTRTSTVLPPPGPEPGASTNSATWAGVETSRHYRRLLKNVNKKAVKN